VAAVTGKAVVATKGADLAPNPLRMEGESPGPNRRWIGAKRSATTVAKLAIGTGAAVVRQRGSKSMSHKMMNQVFSSPRQWRLFRRRHHRWN
jgi:hypothetical protein